MRAVLTNFGSTGDVQPFIALALELERHGHHPVLTLSPYYASWVKRLGLEFVPLGPDLQEVQRRDLAMIISHPEIFDSPEFLYSSSSRRLAALPEAYNELKEACRKADVLISGMWQPASRMVHEIIGIPLITISVNHVPGSRTGLGSKGTDIYREVVASLINPFRQQLGLAPLADPLTSDAVSERLTLFALSRHVHPPVPGWPENFHLTGYFFLDEEGWEPPAEVLKFLSAGEKPVVITFGSMVHADAEALTDLVLEAVRMAGYRAIIQRGWSGLATRKLPPSVLAVDFIPHDWLFPRSACVVHHSAIGTAASVFRAGVPCISVPHCTDQHVWGELAQELGCAGPAIPYTHLTVENLALAIAKTTNTPSYYQAAADLSQKIRAEHGVQNARQLIEQALVS